MISQGPPPFPFDPTYGYDRQKLLTVPVPNGPDDFDDFWKATNAETLATPLKLQRRKVASVNPRFAVWEVEFNSLDGFRVGGWLSVPVDGQIVHGIVVGHGYGGRGEPAFVEGAAAISPCARGFNRSASSGYPNNAFQHVLYGMESRETYSHRGCVADLWQAVSALQEIFPELTDWLHYYGGSFGGGIGAMALAYENRFRKGYLSVPSFGNIPLRLQCPCIGSGEAVRNYHRRHPECIEVLQYFDSAISAQRIKIPIFFACALFDPSVPPPGQFAVHNAVPGDKRLFVVQAGHFPYPEETAVNAKIEQQLHDWWRS